MISLATDKDYPAEDLIHWPFIRTGAKVSNTRKNIS